MKSFLIACGTCQCCRMFLQVWFLPLQSLTDIHVLLDQLWRVSSVRLIIVDLKRRTKWLLIHTISSQQLNPTATDTDTHLQLQSLFVMVKQTEAVHLILRRRRAETNQRHALNTLTERQEISAVRSAVASPWFRVPVVIVPGFGSWRRSLLERKCFMWFLSSCVCMQEHILCVI